MTKESRWVLKEASEDFDNLNQALRILAASIEDHINNLTQGKKPEEVLEFFEKYEIRIKVEDRRIVDRFISKEHAHR